jgi:hypothetical protein
MRIRQSQQGSDRFPDCVSLLQDEKTRAAKKAITSETVWHYAEK